MFHYEWYQWKVLLSNRLCYITLLLGKRKRYKWYYHLSEMMLDKSIDLFYQLNLGWLSTIPKYIMSVLFRSFFGRIGIVSFDRFALLWELTLLALWRVYLQIDLLVLDINLSKGMISNLVSSRQIIKLPPSLTK